MRKSTKDVRVLPDLRFETMNRFASEIGKVRDDECRLLGDNVGVVTALYIIMDELQNLREAIREITVDGTSNRRAR
jgi:hypothetical protein